MLEESLVFLVGGAAIVLSSLRLMPQVLKTFRTKSAGDLSLSWEILGAFSQAFWVAYGILRSDFVIIVGASIILFFFIVLIFQKLNFK